MSGSRLIQLIKEIARDQMPLGLELATVISPPPNLVVRIDNMPVNLQGDDLLVCAHLLPETRYAHIISNPPDTVTYNDQIFEQVGTNIFTQHTKIEFQDQRLQAGDRVVVMALPGGQQYLVLDKVVVMGG